MATQRSPATDWYKTAFRYDYLRVYPHRNDEEARRQVDFLLGILDIPPPAHIDSVAAMAGTALELNPAGLQVTDWTCRKNCRAGNAPVRARGWSHLHPGRYARSSPCLRFDLLVNFFTSFAISARR